MIKLIGIAVLLLTAVGFGFTYSHLLDAEYRRVLGFIKLAKLIRVRIECFSQPLSEIYGDFSDEALDSCGFTEDLQKSGFITALCKHKALLGIRGELLSCLSDFGGELGKSFSDEQVRHCERYIALLEEKASEIERELPTRTKMARVLSFSVAVMMAILLM